MTELGTRHNQDKVKLGLISPEAKAGCAKVLMFGTEKYAAWNWMKGLQIDEVLESMERHMDAIRKGELYDADSGLPHADHIQCNAMFLSHFHHTGMWADLDSGMPPARVDDFHSSSAVLDPYLSPVPMPC